MLFFFLQSCVAVDVKYTGILKMTKLVVVVVVVVDKTH